jgi:hypothetical protein
MNRIMLIIEYMNAIYALKKQDNNCYPATSSFCIEYSVVIVVYTRGGSRIWDYGGRE